MSGATEDFLPAFDAAQRAGFGGSDAQTQQFLQQLAQQQQQFGGIGGRGVDAAFGTPLASGPGGPGQLAQQQAMGLFGQAGSFDQLAADRTAQLHQLAAPGEQRQTNATLQNLFGSGRLGNTGGARALEGLARGQDQAATARGLAGMDFAQQQQQQLLGLGFQGLGQAQQAIGQDQARGLGLGSLGAGFLRDIPGLGAAGVDASVGMDQRGVGRAQQRLAGLEGLFGFGTGLQRTPLSGASAALGATAPLDARAQQQASNALAGSQIATSGGQTAAQIQSTMGSPFGTALTGLGTGLMARDSFFT